MKLTCIRDMYEMSKAKEKGKEKRKKKRRSV